MGRVALSVILPTLEERRNIGPLLARLEAAVGPLAHEVIVVDDDSQDGTGEAVEAWAREHPAVTLLRRRGRTGLCSAIQEGIERSAGDAVAWMDCDLSMPPELVPALYAAVAAGADVAVGSRYVAGGRDARAGVPLHRAMSRALNVFLRVLLRSGLTDYTSGFVCARRAVLERIPLTGRHGEYCIDLLHRARRLGLRVVELPYENAPRAHGRSKTGTSLPGLLRQGLKYVALALRLRSVR